MTKKGVPQSVVRRRLYEALLVRKFHSNGAAVDVKLLVDIESRYFFFFRFQLNGGNSPCSQGGKLLELEVFYRHGIVLHRLLLSRPSDPSISEQA